MATYPDAYLARDTDPYSHALVANPDADGGAPILLATREGHAGVVRALLEDGADPDLRPRAVRLTQDLAMAAGPREAWALMQRGADPCFDDSHALRIACFRGNVRLVRALLEAGANPDADGGAPILLATRGGHAGLVRALLEAGADPDARGGAPLAIAMREGHARVVRALLRAGADPSALTQRHERVVHGAAAQPTARLAGRNL